LSLLALGGWLAALPPPGAGAWREPARAFAARVLAERHARVLKRGRRIAYCPVAELHRLRIAVKKLRYATEFFAGLFHVKDMAVQRTRLERLQDILGRINDAATVEPLVAAAVAVAPGRDVAAAADSVRDWHQVRAAGERAKLQSAWRRFRAAQRPWRE
jgi:CHAD domain-containing protein